ncbi:MAG: hypothetical protein NVS9B5_01690 [Terriglobales bacterium]
MFPLMATYRFFIEAIVLLVTMATGRSGLARCYGSGLEQPRTTLKIVVFGTNRQRNG